MIMLGIILLAVSLMYGIRAVNMGLPAFGFDYWLCMIAIFVSVQIILND